MSNSGKMWLSFGLIGILLFVILYFNPSLYKTPWAIQRWIEISLVLLFSNYISKVSYHDVLTVAKARIEKGYFGQIDPEMMKVVDNILVFEYSGILYGLLIGIFIYRRLTKEEHKKSLNFDELLFELSKHFRFARCMIELDPTKNQKILDFSQTPFRLKEEIIPFFKKNGAIGAFRYAPTSEESFYMIRDKADAACLKTLGRRFTSIDDLTYYEKWLFAVFCLKLKSKKYGKDKEYQDAETILGDISYHINGEGNLKRANALTNAAIKKYRNDPDIMRFCNEHSFVSGVLKELFHQAKSRGVHPSFHFNWLYTVDRTLMLVLDETGMPDERGGVIEVASPESGIECLYPRLHWTNEKKTKTRLFDPACSYIMDYIEEYLVKTYGFVKESEAIAIIAEQQKRFEGQGEIEKSPDAA